MSCICPPRFPDEISSPSSSVLQRYTQSGCQFDCLLQRAFSLCRCIPYNYPRSDGNADAPLCDPFGAFCFKAAMANITDLSSCGCEADCNKVGLSRTHSAETLGRTDRP